MIKIHGKVVPVTKLTGKIIESKKPLIFRMQAKTVEPSAEYQTVAPDGDFVGLFKVTVNPVKLQSKNVEPSPDDTIIMPDTGYVGLEKVTILSAQLQEKTVDPMTESQEVTPNTGYYGLKKVIVNAAPLQEKTADPMTKSQEITADAPYYGLEKVTVNAAPLQDKEIAPSAEEKTVTPDGGFYGLSSVIVLGDENLSPENIRAGVRIFGVLGTYNPDGEDIGGGDSGGGDSGGDNGGDNGGGDIGGGDYDDGLVDYNGVRLPDVSPYITSTHPDAIITKTRNAYTLIVFGGDYQITGDTDALLFCECSTSITYSLSADGTSWTPVPGMEDDSTEFVSHLVSISGESALVWANFVPSPGTGSPNHKQHDNSGDDFNWDDFEWDENAVAYLFAGTRLPALPVGEVNTDIYRYAFVVQHTWGSNYFAYFHEKRPVAHTQTTTGTILVGTPDGCRTLEFIKEPDSNVWVLNSTNESSNGIGMIGHKVIWTATDILKEDGTLYLAASEPVPVYE